MIAKHINFKNLVPSNLVRLVKYITSEQEKNHRIGEVMISNCRQDDPQHAALEMLLTQTQNKRAKSDKTYHLLLSFRPGEEPAPEILGRVEREVCSRLGYGEHQRIAVVHRDTDSTHIHVAINKIHPARLVIHDPHHDFRILAQACGELENSLHLREDNHTPTGRTAGERQARDMEAMTGQESLLSWIKRECLPDMRGAETWETLHQVLAKSGLTLALRGNGMVIADVSGAAVKASDVDRAFSKGNLEKRLGTFQIMNNHGTRNDANRITPNKTYRKEPLGPANPLKAEFEIIRAAGKASRTTRLAAIRAEHRQQAAVIREKNQAARRQARRIPAGRMAKKRLYLALRAQCRRELANLREESSRRRNAICREQPRHTWLSWLQSEAQSGREEALSLLRSRAFGLARKTGAAIRGEDHDERQTPATLLPGQSVDTVTKRGAVIYSVGKDALRDDGESFRVSRDAARSTDILALKMAKQRFGEVLRLDGDLAFRNRMVRAAVEGGIAIRFSDPQAEVKRRELANASIPIQQHGKERS